MCFKSDNLKPSDLLKMITTPVEKQRAKSYYLGPHEGRYNEDNKSLGNHSVRIDQKKRSSSKNKRKDKNKSLERDLTNNSHLFKMSNKEIKRVLSITFRISRSTSLSTNHSQNMQNLLKKYNIPKKKTTGREHTVRRTKWD